MGGGDHRVTAVNQTILCWQNRVGRAEWKLDRVFTQELLQNILCNNSTIVFSAVILPTILIFLHNNSF